MLAEGVQTLEGMNELRNKGRLMRAADGSYYTMEATMESQEAQHRALPLLVKSRGSLIELG